MTTTFYEQTILDSIDLEGYDIKGSINKLNPKEKILRLYKIFLDEYGYNIKRYGMTKAFSEWLSGLPSSCSVPFYYNDIIENAQRYYGHAIKDEDAFCDTYFDKLSLAFFELYNKLFNNKP